MLYFKGFIFITNVFLMKKVSEGGVQLSAQDKTDLKAFLLTLSDPSFLTNPDFQN